MNETEAAEKSAIEFSGDPQAAADLYKKLTGQEFETFEDVVNRLLKNKSEELKKSP